MHGNQRQGGDHYRIARDRVLAKLKRSFHPGRLRKLGAGVTGPSSVELPCLAWRFAFVMEPYSAAVLPEGRDLSMKWQILSLEYLGAPAPSAPGAFVSFAHFPETRTYKPTFDGRVLARLSKGVGRERDRFVQSAERCGGILGEESNPCTYFFKVFPRFEVQIARHEADEEFPAACNVLFPDNALDILSPESVVVAAEVLVASLEGKGPAGS